MDETPSNVVEALTKDACASQRAAGLIPRPNDVHAYVRGVVERMEKRDAEQAGRILPKPERRERTVTRSSEDFENEYQKRLRRAGHEPLPGSWTVTRRPLGRPPGARVSASLAGLNAERERVRRERLSARIRLLMRLPEWRARLAEVNPILATAGTPDQKAHCAHLYQRVIEDSERLFGPWWKAPAKRLHFT